MSRSAHSDWPLPFWIAHRGAGKLAPENTLAAFRVGAAHGYRAFECDVKLSRDRIPMLLHDAELERTTSGSGRAADLDWSELSRLDAGSWHSRAYAGEPPATLASVTRFCRASGHALNIEIKPTPGDEPETGRLVALAARALWAGSALQPVLSSFKPDALAAAAQAAPELPRALLVDRLHDDLEQQLQRLGCRALIANHELLDAGLIEQIQSTGRRVLAYTVNDPGRAEELAGWGIDGLITDAVDRFAPGAVSARGAVSVQGPGSAQTALSVQAAGSAQGSGPEPSAN
jgi:glycerophosphoryl diester phosphodiesterase